MGCDVSMHIDCVSGGTDRELELSDDGTEEFEDDEDLSALYQQFIESMEDFGNQGNVGKVDNLSELVDSFKIHTEAASSLARQHSGLQQ